MAEDVGTACVIAINEQNQLQQTYDKCGAEVIFGAGQF
jgi:hypothetical protein